MRRDDDGLNAFRGVLIGVAIGTVMWGLIALAAVLAGWLP